jgi:hypothetical protein
MAGVATIAANVAAAAATAYTADFMYRSILFLPKLLWFCRFFSPTDLPTPVARPI